MGEYIRLIASDGFELGAYRADPSGNPRGGIVVLQDIFGVNPHLRGICDRLASESYSVVAPALFDRRQRDFTAPYTPSGFAEAIKMVAEPNVGEMLLDTSAAIGELQGAGPVAALGFCLGGSVAYAAAVRPLGLSAAVAYYGGMIVKEADKAPQAPIMMHFGDRDDTIPVADIGTIQEKRPDCEIHVYEGVGHAFNCDERPTFDKQAAELAWRRSLEFLSKHLMHTG